MFTKRQTVSISSTPSGAKVYAGNNYIGTTPLKFKTKKAIYSLTFEADGYEPKTIGTVTKTNPLIWLNIPAGFWGFLIDIPYFEKLDMLDYSVSLIPKAPESPKASLASSTTPKPTTIKSVYLPKKEEKPEEVATPEQILKKLPVTLGRIKYDAKTLYKKYNNAVFKVYSSMDDGIAQGSGFFLSSSGIAISNYHVFKDSYKGEEVILLSNGQKYKIKDVLGYSTKYDYIIFQVDGSNFNYIPLTKRGSEIGDKTFAIGSPLGLSNTLSDGLISQHRGDYMIQISTPIDHGSSGGVLLNEYGEAIGITSGGIDTSGANLNYAIDIRVIFEKVPTGTY